MLDPFGSLFMCNSCFSRCTCAQIHVLVHAYEYVHEIHVQYALITVHAIHDVLSQFLHCLSDSCLNQAYAYDVYHVYA